MDYNFKQICFNKRLNVKKKIKKVLFIFKQKSILVLYIYMKNKKMEKKRISIIVRLWGLLVISLGDPLYWKPAIAMQKC